MKEKYLTLNEIKAMTKKEFKQLLVSQGFDVTDYPDKYRLIIRCHKESFNHICSLYGASGYYSEKRELGAIGNWGCNDSMYEFLPKPALQKTEEILQEIRKNFRAEIKQSGYLKIITVFEIPEKQFRKLMVKYSCNCITYSEETKKGFLNL